MHAFNIHLFYCISFARFLLSYRFLCVRTAMDKDILKKRSGEARSKRKLILNQKRPGKIRSFTEIKNLRHHANDGIVQPYY